jgi:hypothetical protein
MRFAPIPPPESPPEFGEGDLFFILSAKRRERLPDCIEIASPPEDIEPIWDETHDHSKTFH